MLLPSLSPPPLPNEPSASAAERFQDRRRRRGRRKEEEEERGDEVTLALRILRHLLPFLLQPHTFSLLLLSHFFVALTTKGKENSYSQAFLVSLVSTAEISVQKLSNRAKIRFDFPPFRRKAVLKLDS